MFSKLVINNDGTHPARSASGNIQLAPGVHTIQLDYFQGPRTMVALKLFITPPGGVESIFDGVFQSSATVADKSPIGDVSGKWVITQSNGFVGLLDLRQEPNGRLSGTARWSGAEDGPISGRLVGDRIEFAIHYSWGQGLYEGISVAGGARIIDGTSTASNGDSANWTATRQVNTPPPRHTDDPPIDADNEANKNDKNTIYQRYIAAYNKLTDLMARGDGETPAAQRAYKEYKKAKEAYEAILN